MFLYCLCLLVEQSKLIEYLDKGLDGTVNLFTGMGGHKGYAHQCVLGSAGRGYDGVDEYSLLKGTLGDLKGAHGVADIKGDDGALGVAYLKALLAESLQGIVSHCPEVLNNLRILLQNLQAAARCSGGRRVLEALKM